MSLDDTMQAHGKQLKLHLKGIEETVDQIAGPATR